ncbi:unnamed protein product [Cylicocyclus nassatus]|uniref:C2H2-type domain-containing protein n=1 Tax=Cylicocyclus nassatus TaxID=53992 RepID=A0AA36H2T5_CYLNA|nr:unnamed protein product [Cylicocyclus nassatus]
MKAELYKHLARVHGYTKEQIDIIKTEKRREKLAATGKPIFVCELCGAQYTNEVIFQRHQRAKHPDDYTLKAIRCPICDEEAINHRELTNHARLCHSNNEDDFIVERLSFTNKQDFEVWRIASEEAHVISRFTSKVKHTEDAKIIYMRCHQALRTPNDVPKKTKKTVAYCTAYMNITEKEDGISVEHCFTHCGHEANPAKLRLDKDAEQYIISLLKDGLTVRQVHKKLRAKVRGGPRTRLYFTTTRDIRNLATRCRVQPGRLHNLDTTSVQMRVDLNDDSDGVQFFRAAQDASGDGFTLVVITPIQKEWLGKYGRRALCLDDTFNLTSYSLRLTTVVVADEWDRALPAAYLLSYRMTEVEVGILFECVKKLLPSFHTEFFMTDDTNTFWNGFRKVFTTTHTKRLLCLWHVQQAMKRNASSKLVNSEHLKPFMKKAREICLIRSREIFTIKYTSLLKFLRDQSENVLATYMENSWSDRIEQWAAFGRLGSCVSTSMLCERFHKTLKHDILEGKANVRIDSLLQLLINLVTEAEEEREIAMERGVEEGRYRLQQHHKSHAAAVSRYADRPHTISVTGSGQWEVKDDGCTYQIQEHFCPCDSQLNNHCKREDCKACPYAYACNCSMDVRSGISCHHVHAVLMYAPSGMRAAQESPARSPSPLRIVIDSSDEDEMIEVEDEDLYVMDEEAAPLPRRSTDNRDEARDVMQKIEMDYAAGNVDLFTLRSHTSDEVVMATIREAGKLIERYKKLMADAKASKMGKENSVKLARRTGISSVGRPQGFTPIRKLHKRSHLRKCERSKRKRTPELEIPDCAADERDTCSVCLRMQPNNLGNRTEISWIQCPKCENWMHSDCVGTTCPDDGTSLE